MGISVPPGASPGAGDRYDSFSTLAGAYQDQINAIVGADGYSIDTLTITAVPEPSSVALLAMILIGGRLRRPTRSICNR